MLPHSHTPVGTDACMLAERWILDPRLAEMVVRLERMAKERFATPGVQWIRWPGLLVISGYRTPEEQAHLNPSVQNSRHTLCPSMAVDLRVGQLAIDPNDPGALEIWQILGGMWELMGGRWGGRFSKPDPNHFDLG